MLIAPGLTQTPGSPGVSQKPQEVPDPDIRLTGGYLQGRAQSITSYVKGVEMASALKDAAAMGSGGHLAPYLKDQATWKLAANIQTVLRMVHGQPPGSALPLEEIAPDGKPSERFSIALEMDYHRNGGRVQGDRRILAEAVLEIMTTPTDELIRIWPGILSDVPQVAGRHEEPGDGS